MYSKIIRVTNPQTPTQTYTHTHRLAKQYATDFHGDIAFIITELQHFNNHATPTTTKATTFIVVNGGGSEFEAFYLTFAMDKPISRTWQRRQQQQH